jgi:hypothetical protein
MDPMESGCRSETMIITLDCITVYVLYVLNLTLWFSGCQEGRRGGTLLARVQGGMEPPRAVAMGGVAMHSSAPSAPSLVMAIL